MRWAIAATLVKPDRSNFGCCLNIYEAESEEDAELEFIYEVNKRFPEHEISVKPLITRIDG